MLFWRMDLKRLFLKMSFIMAVLSTVWTAFFVGTEANAQESKPIPPRFGKVLVLFSAETPKEDRDAFLDGLEEARLRHQQDYRELVRKSAKFSSERGFYHNPWFLEAVDVQMIRQLYNTTSERAWALEQLLPLLGGQNWQGFEALIVVASDKITSELNSFARDYNRRVEPKRDDMVILFAGVSSFDESVREPQIKGDKTEPALFPNAFAILHPVDPWPNTELALSVFPKTKNVILLTPEKLWNAEKETAFRAKLGPGKTLKTIPISEVDEKDTTEADIARIRNMFAASVRAEIQPDTVIVSMSSVESGQDPVSWLPDKFSGCPVFADTVPVHPSSVGGFCRSMEKLGVQTAELLEQLSEAPLNENRLPPSVLENDDLWLNEAALKRYGLKASDFPDSVILVNTNSSRKPRIRIYSSWSKKRIALLLGANAAVLFALYLFALVSIRAARRKRLIDEMIYGALPVRVTVMDRDGRIIARHKQYGEVEQEGEFPWKNVEDVPWLRDIRALELVREAFDSGKTVVRRLEVDGQHRIVVLSRTSSDLLGRPVVIAVSSDAPTRKSQA
ncbi:MAG: hypothetical protein J6W70_05030 [Lentisphaeria bacterium]|nr:hypothetical protein [Lentisphaeria bacterium]